MATKPKYLWKFLRTGLKSEHGNCEWKVGEWKKHEGEVSLCASGFHASEKIFDALQYVPGEILAKVEVCGACDKQHDKQAWSEMRIVQAYSWTKTDSVELAVFAAESCLEVFETKYPDDKRPRKAIAAAKAYLKNQTKPAAAGAAEVGSRTKAKIERWLQARVKKLKVYKK